MGFFHFFPLFSKKRISHLSHLSHLSSSTSSLSSSLSSLINKCFPPPTKTDRSLQQMQSFLTLQLPQVCSLVLSFLQFGVSFLFSTNRLTNILKGIIWTSQTLIKLAGACSCHCWTKPLPMCLRPIWRPRWSFSVVLRVCFYHYQWVHFSLSFGIWFLSTIKEENASALPTGWK